MIMAMPSFSKSSCFKMISEASKERFEKLRVHDKSVRTVGLKPRPNDRNTPTQHIATLLGATCCVRLATMLRCVGCCWLKFENGQT